MAAVAANQAKSTGFGFAWVVPEADQAGVAVLEADQVGVAVDGIHGLSASADTDSLADAEATLERIHLLRHVEWVALELSSLLCQLSTLKCLLGCGETGFLS